MRLATFRYQGAPGVGVVEGGEIRDVRDIAPTMQTIVENATEMLPGVERAARDAARLPLSAVELLAPLPRPRKNVFCLGLNYKEHVAEGNWSANLPTLPVWFTNVPTAVCGPYDDIQVDMQYSQAYDWEVELAVVIGRAGRRIPKANALDHIFGFTAFNDFTVRDVQNRHGNQWFKGKSWEQGSPMGPWIVTADEFGDPQQIEVMCRVNGVEKQHSNTRMMIFDIATAIADLSEVMTLEPGDVIATGTPSGVGYARKPQEFLKPGDVLETEVENIGVLRNRIVGE